MNTHTSTSSAQTSNSLRGWLTAPVPTSAFQANIQQLRRSWFKLMANTSAVFGLAVIVLLVLVAIFAPLIATHDIGANNLANRLQPPSWGHFFGTDELGRDIFSRLVYGSRITLYIVTLTAVIAAPIGLVVGTTAGYMGGWVDTALMRIVDIFLAFPSLVLALSFAAALGPGIENAVIAISLAAWPPIARLARAETLTIRSSDYVAAIRLQGASTMRVITKHVVPMCIPSVVIRITLNMSSIILTAAGLGFLGLGAQPPSPEWGAMLSSGREFMMTSWWLAAVPGTAILIASLAFNLFGDGLRDVLDPRNG
ncbi:MULTISPECIES: nickel transporter permease [Brucella/Ochrobactrum group]|uniref:Binding-protein-dependent transport systems inner membrane component n=1 Tax=Brucella anthropi (strain ATCC 49188 / DSM 6882 / CCUG 24695 / JCM 21032 / LMG 3331 / NBRC 15819 / NCTC 12168 / Alc 37) TaxID=439375 RepID=A6X3J4_BRUA4|nr:MULTISPECIES: nickel transporter permease [Brucella/Ochrobactrum group]ABS15798.1 binding-protein-dependent transport systems inner membrane component [Brucella anthropi ATCC 49188]KAB2735441.1 ABC transporter permease [Brucella anthropi]KAB2751277.1 ABC transporter permease [Brucella anthropi]KAB2757422.1 ABC transporter permease [Brucella anthropi]KAB2777363.1 ABC transporter permease [Brucella anthropi]